MQREKEDQVRTRRKLQGDKITSYDIAVFKEHIKVLNAVNEGSLQLSLSRGDLGGMDNNLVVRHLTSLKMGGHVLSRYPWISAQSVIAGEMLVTLTEKGERLREFGNTAREDAQIRTFLESKRKVAIDINESELKNLKV